MSFGGRSTLLKYVIWLLPTYFMSLFKALTTIFTRLKSIGKNFFLVVYSKYRKMVWISLKKKSCNMNNRVFLMLVFCLCETGLFILNVQFDLRQIGVDIFLYM